MQKWSEKPRNSVHGIRVFLQLQANGLHCEAENYNNF